jgi:hypothetical protein
MIEIEEFYSKIEKKDNGCWEWITISPGRRYGKFKQKRAHRWAYEYFVGPIPEGMYACHKCDNTKCVNPNHIFPGTQKDNINDAKQKGRLATGDRHGSHTHPESIARGERNGVYTHPEKRIEHSNHLKKLYREHPERVLRGDDCPWTKLSSEKYEEVYAMKRSGCSLKEMADKFNISVQRISHICCAAGLRGRPK